MLKIQIPSPRRFYILKEKGNTMIFSKDKLFKLKKALLSLGEVSTEQGLLIYDGEDLEVGKEVFVDGDEGLVPASDGEYTYNDQIILVEGGLVKSITEKEIEQPAEETEETTETETVETETSEEEKTEETEETETETEETETEEEVEGPTVEELQAIIEEQKAMIESLKAENEELKKKLEEPAAEPAEEEFKKENPEKEDKKIDFSKYIKHRK